jgi:hypothetical protein
MTKKHTFPCPHCHGAIDIAAVIAEHYRRIGAAGGKSRWDNMTPEERSAASQNKDYPTEARVRAARKSWETRRAKAAAKPDPSDT